MTAARYDSPTAVRLDYRLYNPRSAARLIGVSAATVRVWLNGNRSPSSVVVPVLRERIVRESPPLATWGEFVGLYTTAAVRRSGLRMRVLREFIAGLRSRSKQPYVLTTLAEQKKLHKLAPTGLLDEIDYDEHGIARLIRPAPRVEINPAKMGGQPVIAGHRIATESMPALAGGRGLEPARIARLYGITAAEVRAAVVYESMLDGLAEDSRRRSTLRRDRAEQS